MRRANSYQPTSTLAAAITSPFVPERKLNNTQEYVRPKRVSTSTGHQRPTLPDAISAVSAGMQQSGFIPLIREDGSSSTTPPNAGGVHASVSVPKRLIPLPGAVPFFSDNGAGKDPAAPLQTNFDASRSTPGTSSLGTNHSRRSRTSSVSEESRAQHIPDLAHAHQQSQAQLIQQQLHQMSLSLQRDNNNTNSTSNPASDPQSTSSPAPTSSTHIHIPLSLLGERKNSSDELLATMGCPALATPPSSGPGSPAVNSLLANDKSTTPRDRSNGNSDGTADDHPHSESPSPQVTPSSAADPDGPSSSSNSKQQHTKVGMASSAPATSNFRTITVSTVNSSSQKTSETSGSLYDSSSSGSSSSSTPSTSLGSKTEATDDEVPAKRTTVVGTSSAHSQSKEPSDSIVHATNAGTAASGGGSTANVSGLALATSAVSLGNSWEDRTETESVFSSSSDHIDEYSDDDDLGYVRISPTGTNARLLIQHLSVFSLEDEEYDSTSTDSDDSVSSEEDSGDDDSVSSASSDEDGIRKSTVSSRRHKKYNLKSTESKEGMATSSSSLSSTHAGGSNTVVESSSSSLASIGTLGASTMFHMDDVHRVKKKGHQKRRDGPTRWTNRPLPPQGPLPYLRLPLPLDTSVAIQGSIASSTSASSTTTEFQLPDFSVVNVKRSRLEMDAQLEFFNMKIVYDVNKTGFEATHDFPIRIGDVIAGRYEIVEYLGSAAFSRAVKCIDHLKGTAVCLKIIKNNKDYFDQSLDEIKLLTIIRNACQGRCDDFHVLELYDYFYFKEHLFLVCELLRENLYEVYKYNRQSGETLYFNVPRLQRVAWQALLALNFIHSRNLIHCDLKPENILIKSYSRSLIKVIDFGSSCFTSDQLSSYVQSRSYRAPEVVLGYPYDQRIDMWSLGCILAELWTGRVLFQNESLGTLIAKHIGIIGLQKSDRSYLKQAPLADDVFTAEGVIFEKKQGATGTSTANGNGGGSQPGTTQTVASASAQNSEFIQIKRTTLKKRLQTSDHLFLSFVSSLLRINPEERPTSWQAMHHPWFRQSYPDP